jgi:nucleoid-associated protein YgaU
MNDSRGPFCRLYRPVGALLWLLAILFLLLRSCQMQAPAAIVPMVEPTATVPATEIPTAPPTVAPTVPSTPIPTAMPTAVPTSPPPTALAIAAPRLNLPATEDYTAQGVRLGGTGQPGATVEVWDGATRVGTAVVGADGVWSLLAKLGEGVHELAVRTVDAAGNVLNEAPALEVTVPVAMVQPELNLPAAADYTPAGVALSGTGQPGATVEVWDGATRVGTAVVDTDGVWSLLANLGGGAHWLVMRTVDAAGNPLNESPPVELVVPEAQAPPVAEDLTVSGEAYTVQWGDWLLKLARRFYGDPDLYTRIVDGTNAKAAVDSSFHIITNPNHIQVGQKLWIPAVPGGK